MTTLCPSAGLQHEGIFRVSGAQLRVSEIRDAFERGGDGHGGLRVGASLQWV